MKQKLRNESGQSMVEFALILPVLLFIVIGIIEFGFMFSGYLALTNASREAVRYISLGGDNASAIQRAKDVSMNLDPNQMTILIDPSGGIRERGDSVKVTIQYDYKFLTPFFGVLFGNTLELEADAVMRVE